MQQLGDNPGQRLLVVANRLPVNVSITETGKVETTMACGGLVSGLQAFSKSIPFLWFGWPGTNIHRHDRDRVRKELKSQHGAVPIFLNSKDVDNFYNGFSNSLLWPLLHGLPARAKFDEAWKTAYVKVNEQFADAIEPYLKDGDRIWIHDYHLMLLPRFLRDRLGNRKNVRMGFFLHTPFPSADTFGILPLSEAICDGIMSCDLMGFHIRDYVDNFLDSAESLLPEVRRTPNELHYGERKITAQAFPIGVDPGKFRTSVASKATQKQISILQDNFRGKKIILGVDRLDYSKGIPQKLHAFDNALADNPDWIGRVVLIQLCVPTRSCVPEYKTLRHEVEEMVGRINGNHGTATWTPVQYLHRSLDEPTLHALYAVSDVCIIASIGDGLNLVSYEYVACQTDSSGVLMLSRYTGASRMLESAVIFCPWDTPRFSNTIIQALEMPEEERKQRMETAIKAVNHWTCTRWGLSFLEKLQSNDVELRN